MSNFSNDGRRPHRVLIVDDDQEIRDIVTDVLTTSGYETLAASRTDEALWLIEEHAPDVVITDALMPGGDGRELCRIVKSDQRLANTKVIIMTSLYKSPRYKYEAFRTFKADDYLLKPVDFPQLLATLERLVPHARMSGAA